LRFAALLAAELGQLKPVAVSKALHLLFDIDQPELPPPPAPLPPISAKLIFVDRTNLGQVPEADPLLPTGDRQAAEAAEGVQAVKLEVASQLPPGDHGRHFFYLRGSVRTFPVFLAAGYIDYHVSTSSPEHLILSLYSSLFT
jgi:hypothetical protein